MYEVICKVCNHTIYYDIENILIDENNTKYILCDCCLNEIIIEEEK